MSHHQRSRSLEIDMGLDNGDSANELGEYLIQRDKSAHENNNSITGFFNKVGDNIKKIVPGKRMGTGSIEDDIAVRFGMFSSLTGSNGTTDGSATSSSWFSGCGYTMSRKERIIGFFVCLGLGILFFTMSAFYIPVLLFKARKFSIFFTFGSVFTFAGLSLLWGFVAFIRHLFSSERLPFTVLYFGSLFATLYFSIGLGSTILTVVGISVQILSLLSFFISYLPGGVAGLTYLTKFVSSSFTRSLPI